MGVDAEMFVRVKPKMTESAVRQLAAEMFEAIGQPLNIMKPGEWNWEPHGRHCLSIVSKWEQDGPSIKPKKGEQFIKVHLWTRYYGVGYERGDLPAIIAIAEYLEERTGGEVWYGGDSSGMCAEHFDEAARKALWSHFVKVGHTPYRRGFALDKRQSGPTCDFCAGYPMHQFAWSGERRTGWACGGCDQRIWVYPNGETKPYLDTFDSQEGKRIRSDIANAVIRGETASLEKLVEDWKAFVERAS